MKVSSKRGKFLWNIRRPSVIQVIILSMILNKLLNYNKKLFLQTI